jgi:hypothetical protein
MMNFDTPKAKQDNGPKINPDGTVEFVSPTDSEKAALLEAKAAGIRKNTETGGSGRILSSEEKAGSWYGNRMPDDESSSEWTLNLEKPVSEVVQTAAEALEGESPLEVLERQIDDIAKKRANIVVQSIQATDEGEKKRLQALADALEKGHDTKMREYQDMIGASQERKGAEDRDKLTV